MSTPQGFRVFKIKDNLAMQDPDMPQPRYHTFIFVETNADGPGTGTKHHVTGDIVQGMHYESKPLHNPDESRELHSKEFLGYTMDVPYSQAWNSLLEDTPAPSRQKAFNARAMRTEPVKSWDPLVFYETGEPRRPLIKCTEWTEQRAIPALYRQGLIRSNQGSGVGEQVCGISVSGG